MVICGFDPGLERVGYGVIRKVGSRLEVLDFGLIQTPQLPLPQRLQMIYEESSKLIEKHQPSVVATERLMFAANKTTAFDVSKALGVILLAAEKHCGHWNEFTPPQVKKAICGVGSADKKQVEYMVMRLLNIQKAPKPDDVTDALAIAICQAFHAPLTLR